VEVSLVHNQLRELHAFAPCCDIRKPLFIICRQKVTWGDHENMHTGPRAGKLVTAATPWCHGIALVRLGPPLCRVISPQVHFNPFRSLFRHFAVKRSPGAIMKTCTRAREPGNSSQQPPHGAMGSPWYDWGHRYAELSHLRCTSIRFGHFFVILPSKGHQGHHKNMHTGPGAIIKHAHGP